MNSGLKEEVLAWQTGERIRVIIRGLEQNL